MIIKTNDSRINTRLMSVWTQHENKIRFYEIGCSSGSVTFTLVLKDADVALSAMHEIDNAIDAGCKLLDLDEDLPTHLIDKSTKPKTFTVKYRGMVNDYVSVDAKTAATSFMMELNVQVGDGLTVECENGVKKMYTIERSAKLIEVNRD